MTIHLFTLRPLLFFLLAALLAVALAACGGDDDDADAGNNGNGDAADDADNGADDDADSGGDDGADTDSSDSADGSDDDNGGSDPAPSGDGSGTLVVGDATLEFSVRYCGFDGEETGNEDVPFTLTGLATDVEGRDLAVDASIVDLGEGSLGEIHTLSVYDMESYEEVYASASTFGGDAAEFQIDGTTVSYEGEFWGDDGETPLGAGTFQAACP